MYHPFISFLTIGNFYVALKKLILIHFKDICVMRMSKPTFKKSVLCVCQNQPFKKSYGYKFIAHLKAYFSTAKIGLEHSYL